MANWGSFDFSAFEKLGANIEAMRKAWPGFLVECVHELANRLLAKVVLRTPVDTGELRRGWTLGPVSITSAGATIEVYNPVIYAPYVEFGHRIVYADGWIGWQEGRFMMTISSQEIERELPAIMERRMKRFVEKYLGR